MTSSAYDEAIDQAANWPVVWINVRTMVLLKRNELMFPKRRMSWLFQWDEEKQKFEYRHRIDDVIRNADDDMPVEVGSFDWLAVTATKQVRQQQLQAGRATTWSVFIYFINHGCKQVNFGCK
jgi:hypothetical protein